VRRRGKNENNNTLKTKGYHHFEHNFGHGQNHFSSLLPSLIILAFLTHSVLEWMDGKYQVPRKKLLSRKRLFNDIRNLTSSVFRDLGGVDGLHAEKLRSADSEAKIQGEVVKIRIAFHSPALMSKAAFSMPTGYSRSGKQIMLSLISLASVSSNSFASCSKILLLLCQAYGLASGDG
jgi:hypothetical protein